MTSTNEHLEKLNGARSLAVKARREAASVLAEPFRRGHTEEIRELFVAIQNTVEALDRATADEERIERSSGTGAG